MYVKKKRTLYCPRVRHDEIHEEIITNIPVRRDNRDRITDLNRDGRLVETYEYPEIITDKTIFRETRARVS